MKNVFVYNPESGNGKLKKYKDYIVENLSKKFGEIEVIETSHAGHACEIASEKVEICDYFFVSGGDGTLNEVINGFRESEKKPIIGYIPCGTVNDVAKSLSISKNIKKAVKGLLDSEVYEHDIFKVNDRYGIYVCCAGLFTGSSYQTPRKDKKRFGKIAYFFKGAKELFHAKPIHVELITENEKTNRNCAMMLILNSRSVAGFKLNKNAKLNDGVVELVFFHSHENHVKLSEIMRCMGAFAFGLDRYKNSKKVTYRQLSNFTLNIEENTIINMDGEKSGEGSFNFKVLEKAVKILVPRKGK